MKRWIWPAAAAAALGLAGCGGSGAATPRTGSTTTTPPPASTSTGTSGPSGTSASSGASGTANPATTATTTTTAATGTVAECTTAQLAPSIANPNGAAGSVYYDLVLTNNGGTACFVQGYPGVSFVTSQSGSQVGAAAGRQLDPNVPGTPPVDLAPGESASSVLRVAEAGNYPQGTCRPAQVPGLRVYPPDQQTSLYVPLVRPACASASVDLLAIEPLH